MRPLLSIITVTFNASATLPATLNSITSQQGCTEGIDYEWIIMDGASSDDTCSIASSSSINAQIYSEPDKGIYDAMNKGIHRSAGQYLMFLNAGDRLHSSTTIADICHTIRNCDMPDIVYGQTNLVDSNGIYIAPRHLSAPRHLTFKSFAQGMLVCHQAFIPKKTIVPEYDLRYRFSADYDWCIKCIRNAHSSMLIPDVLIDYLLEGTTTANRKASLKERFNIMCRYYGTIPTLWRHIAFIPRFLKQRLIENKSSND